MKKLFAVLMAIALVLTMGTTFAFAAGDGTITIDNAIVDSTYSVYKMLHFTPSKTDANKGIYTIVDGWADFFAGDTAKEYFDVVTQGDQTTVVLKENGKAVDQKLAQAALKYAEDNKIAPAVEPIKATSKDVVFTGLDYGYYAIDTTVGTMGALTRASNELKAVEKNIQPDIDKQVQEDRDDSWGVVNDADIDQQVNYQSNITIGEGVTNYVMHDTMEDSLTFNNDVVVKLADGTVVDASNYTVTVSPADGHTFDVAFDNDYILGLAKGTILTVYYSATLNENAVIGANEDGNENEVYLSYGEDAEWKTNVHETSTYTWEMDVKKYTMEGDQKVTLAGAVFQILDKDGNAIKFSAVDGAAVPTYKVDADGAITEITTDVNGKFIIVGLDEGKYALHEESAPEGYNKLAEDMEIIITSELNGREDDSVSYKINDSEPVTIEVENKTGGLFPETGGIGTTIFYLVGGLLMLAAFVILVSKKRMASFA
jgi:fimbrial isopeptide formation D2 family protein/LPXTG-motif cell wall-anchored protein